MLKFRESFMSKVDPGKNGLWKRASSHWQLVGSPLRPCQEDIDYFRRFSLEVLDGQSEATIALLGVTPELVQLDWPGESQLYAIDHSEGMMLRLWSSNEMIASCPVLAKWQKMPFAESTFDLALCDNPFWLFADIQERMAFIREIHSVLRANGNLLLRCFFNTPTQESVDDVMDELHAGGIGSFHVFKMRLMMSRELCRKQVVYLKEAHQAFESLIPNRQELSKARGWNPEIIDTIDFYRGVEDCYWMPTLDELMKNMQGYFQMEQISRGSYELSERCPTFLLSAV